MKKAPAVLSLAIAALAYSCGGTIGNIEKYTFEVNADTLRAAVERVFLKYPELRKKDTILYGYNDARSFTFVLDHDNEKVVFSCHIIVYQSGKVDLSLTSATTWGYIMQLAPHMSWSEKRHYRKLFEEFILPKIEEQAKIKVRRQHRTFFIQHSKTNLVFYNLYIAFVVCYFEGRHT